MVTLTFGVPAPLWLTANGRLHWAEKSARTRALRQAARIITLNEIRKREAHPMQRANVTATVHYPRTGRQDPANAAPAVKALIDGRGKPTAGIRIGVRSKGCSGLSYTLEFADKQEPMDEVIETGGIKLLIDPKASLFLIGTEMDYEEEKLKSGFVFRNPNEKGRCGCGESFHV